MVSKKKLTFAAEVYKAFLNCACKIIRDSGGKITAFDGDRVMAIYHGKVKNTNAVRAALKINYAVRNIINPSLKRVYPDTDYVVRHGTGIDNGQLLVAKVGVKGANDLVWVGSAANIAAKLSDLREGGYNTWISKNVFDAMSDDVKYSKNSLMWEIRNWTTYNRTIYCSSYWWPL